MSDWVERYFQSRREQQAQKGGPGSGHWGHAGRPGERGGSVSGSVAMSVRTGATATQRRLQSKYHVPDLKRGFTSMGKAREWIESKGIEAGYGWKSREIREVGDTLKDIEGKIGLLPIKRIQHNSIYNSSFSVPGSQININPKDNTDWAVESTLNVIDRELHNLSTDIETPYKHRLLEQKELLKSGAYHEGHTLYWFGNERNIEAIVRHEMGHAFHERYSDLSATDAQGHVVGIDDLRRAAVGTGTDRSWRDDYGITARGRDNWSECVAENFVAWSVGRTDLMNSKMTKMFDLIAEKSKQRRAIVEGTREG